MPNQSHSLAPPFPSLVSSKFPVCFFPFHVENWNEFVSRPERSQICQNTGFELQTPYFTHSRLGNQFVSKNNQKLKNKTQLIPYPQTDSISPERLYLPRTIVSPQNDCISRERLHLPRTIVSPQNDSYPDNVSTPHPDPYILPRKSDLGK